MQLPVALGTIKVGVKSLTYRWRKPHDPAIISLQWIPACDRQTDGRTDRPPLDITWPYHVIALAISVVGPSLSLVRRSGSGTRYQTVSVTRRSAATVSDNHRTRICFVDTTQQHTSDA